MNFIKRYIVVMREPYCVIIVMKFSIFTVRTHISRPNWYRGYFRKG